VTRFDRIPRDTALLDQVVKEMFQRMQAPMEGGRSSPLLVLLVNKPLDVLKRDLRKRLWTGRKEELEIERRVRERMGGVVTALEIRPEVVDRLAHDIVHVLCSLECLARLDLRHGLGVWRALGGVRDLGVAQRQRDRAMAHELFHHFERGPGIEELRRTGMSAMSFKT